MLLLLLASTTAVAYQEGLVRKFVINDHAGMRDKRVSVSGHERSVSHAQGNPAEVKELTVQEQEMDTLVKLEKEKKICEGEACKKVEKDYTDQLNAMVAAKGNPADSPTIKGKVEALTTLLEKKGNFMGEKKPDLAEPWINYDEPGQLFPTDVETEAKFINALTLLGDGAIPDIHLIIGYASQGYYDFGNQVLPGVDAYINTINKRNRPWVFMTQGDGDYGKPTLEWIASHAAKRAIDKSMPLKGVVFVQSSFGRSPVCTKLSKKGGCYHQYNYASAGFYGSEEASVKHDDPFAGKRDPAKKLGMNCWGGLQREFEEDGTLGQYKTDGQDKTFAMAFPDRVLLDETLIFGKGHVGDNKEGVFLGDHLEGVLRAGGGDISEVQTMMYKGQINGLKIKKTKENLPVVVLEEVKPLMFTEAQGAATKRTLEELAKIANEEGNTYVNERMKAVPDPFNAESNPTQSEQVQKKVLALTSKLLSRTADDYFLNTNEPSLSRPFINWAGEKNFPADEDAQSKFVGALKSLGGNDMPHLHLILGYASQGYANFKEEVLPGLDAYINKVNDAGDNWVFMTQGDGNYGQPSIEWIASHAAKRAIEEPDNKLKGVVFVQSSFESSPVCTKDSAAPKDCYHPYNYASAGFYGAPGAFNVDDRDNKKQPFKKGKCYGGLRRHVVGDGDGTLGAFVEEPEGSMDNMAYPDRLMFESVMFGKGENAVMLGTYLKGVFRAGGGDISEVQSKLYKNEMKNYKNDFNLGENFVFIPANPLKPATEATKKSMKDTEDAMKAIVG